MGYLPLKIHRQLYSTPSSRLLLSTPPLFSVLHRLNDITRPITADRRFRGARWRPRTHAQAIESLPPSSKCPFIRTATITTTLAQRIVSFVKVQGLKQGSLYLTWNLLTPMFTPRSCTLDPTNLHRSCLPDSDVDPAHQCGGNCHHD